MLLCICSGPRKGATYCTEETMCRFTAKFTLPEMQIKIPTTCSLCWYLSLALFFSVVHLLVPWFPGCTLCWYLGTFFLVVHFVGILVPFPGCTLWYLGTVSWLYTLMVSWNLFLVVNLAVNLCIVFLVQ